MFLPNLRWEVRISKPDLHPSLPSLVVTGVLIVAVLVLTGDDAPRGMNNALLGVLAFLAVVGIWWYGKTKKLQSEGHAVLERLDTDGGKGSPAEAAGAKVGGAEVADAELLTVQGKGLDVRVRTDQHRAKKLTWASLGIGLAIGGALFLTGDLPPWGAALMIVLVVGIAAVAVRGTQQSDEQMAIVRKHPDARRLKLGQLGAEVGVGLLAPGRGQREALRSGKPAVRVAWQDVGNWTVLPARWREYEGDLPAHYCIKRSGGPDLILYREPLKHREADLLLRVRSEIGPERLVIEDELG